MKSHFRFTRIVTLPRVQLAIAVSSLAFISGCNNAAGEPANEGGVGRADAGDRNAAKQTEPETAIASGHTYVETLKLPGASVHGYETTELKAKLGGYVNTIGTVDGVEIDIGSSVRQGTKLAVLDIPEMEDEIREKTAHVGQAESAVLQAVAAVAEAEAEVLQRKAERDQVRAHRAEKVAILKLNKIKYRRLSDLASGGAIKDDIIDEAEYAVAAAQAALESVVADIKAADTSIQAAEAKVRRANADRGSAQAAVAVAQAALERVRTLFRYTTITAPYDGVVTKRMVDHGTFVSPADRNAAAMPLFAITRTDRIKVAVAVPNRRIGRIKAGLPIVFHSIGGLPGRTFSGKITRLAGALDSPDARMLPIEIDFDNSVSDVATGEKVHLQPGLFGTITIRFREWTDANPLPVVPASAVGTDADGRRFVVVVASGRHERRFVEIAFEKGSDVGIAQGISVGDRVAVGDLGQYE